MGGRRLYSPFELRSSGLKFLPLILYRILHSLILTQKAKCPLLPSPPPPPPPPSPAVILYQTIYNAYIPQIKNWSIQLTVQ